MTSKPKKVDQAAERKRYYDSSLGPQIEHLAELTGGVLKFNDQGRMIAVDVNASETEIILTDCNSLLRPQLIAELRRVAEFYGIMADMLDDAELCETEQTEIERQEACDKALRELNKTTTTQRFCNPN